MKTELALCVLLALASTSLDNLGQGLQKAGSEWMPGGLQGLQDRANLRRLAVWVSGILLCAAAPVTLALALVAGPSSLVAALGAFGLVPLYLFAHLVLQEPITRAHLVALTALVAGVAWIGTRSAGQEYPTAALDPQGLLVGCAIAILGPAIWTILAYWRRWPLLGLPLGCLSGALGGLVVVLFERGATLHAWWSSGAAGVAAMIGGFLLLQVAWQHAPAIQVVPANTATALLVPIAVAPFAFHEPVEPWLLGGLAILLFGIGALAWGERRVSSPGSPDPAPPAPVPSGSGRGATGSSAA